MIRTTAKIVKNTFYALMILAGVTFAVSNRGTVDLKFYPLPYEIALPLFLFTIFVFALGLGTGWFISRFHVLEHWRGHRQAKRRITALENELGAARAEQVIRPATATMLPNK